jgi:hypothetical protein
VFLGALKFASAILFATHIFPTLESPVNEMVFKELLLIYDIISVLF